MIAGVFKAKADSVRGPSCLYVPSQMSGLVQGGQRRRPVSSGPHLETLLADLSYNLGIPCKISTEQEFVLKRLEHSLLIQSAHFACEEAHDWVRGKSFWTHPLTHTHPHPLGVLSLGVLPAQVESSIQSIALVIVLVL